MRHFYLSFFLLFLASCSSSESTNYKKSNEIINNLKNNIPNPWKEISAEASDYALENAKTKSLFILNSACRKYESSNLNTLTSSMMTGIENLNITDKHNSFYQEREAAEVTANGTLDGVKRFFKIITIRKNNCIYDYVLISTNDKNLSEDTSALHHFLERIILK
jgi:hypothetical protein